MIEASPRRLLVFKSVVDLGGFNAAADRLGIAQPSVGAHVKALERQVGQALLLRHRGARPQLTEAGHVVYSMAGEVIRLSDEAANSLANLKAKQSQEIVIAVHRDLATTFLPPYLGRYSKKNPRSRVVTRIGTIEDVLGLVESGAVQLGLLLSSGPVQGLQSEIVGREPLFLVAGKSHPLAHVKGVTPADLRKHAFVTGLRQSRYFHMAERALRSIGVEHVDIALELQESASVREAVRHGDYIACLPQCTSADDLRAGTLIALDVAKPIPPLQIRCVYGADPGPAAQRMINILRG
ncbi:MAG: LysR family transcriptional regulator [Hyphomicrobiales bacterium]|jgi:DNA-binding transcriptional LysR family regulator|nr:LysR family transcriptional regulator [Hyphomicrobiales bacterium]